MRQRTDSKRQDIINIAREAFLKSGYAATSMASIATSLGGSKGTLYGYFASKEELFSAVVRGVGEEHVLPMLYKLDLDDDNTSVDATLIDLSQTLINFLVLPQAIASYRLAVAEAGRFPHLGIAFYESGKRLGEMHIARWMGRQMQKGRLRHGDADIMAKQFIALCEVGPYQQMLLGRTQAPSPQEKALLADQAVTTFLAAYGAELG
jgi:TetR/AcrR family transcriptional regulator, mexJK operon transcriptional repressor